MEVLKELTEIKNSNIGLGFFDGVHIAHQKLTEELVKISKNDTKSVILTFKNNPAEYFCDSIEYLTTTQEREDIMSKLGVDYIVELDFTKELANMSAEEYLKEILVKYFSPKHILTGFNHTFGRGKYGNSQFLYDNQKKYNYQYKEIPPIKYDNEIVSSTLIRKYLKEGDIKKANSMLGHSFKISGEVIRGNQIGKTLGFPTANIIYPDNKVKIPFGVYKVNVKINNSIYHNIYTRGMMNYGIKPTINNGENKPVAEVHIIGFNKDIYGENIEISILEKLRDEKKFSTLDELKQQIKEDVSLC